jgi:hypothetical protein
MNAYRFRSLALPFLSSIAISFVSASRVNSAESVESSAKTSGPAVTPAQDQAIVAATQKTLREKPAPGAANVIVREISRIITPQNVMFADAPVEKGK